MSARGGHRSAAAVRSNLHLTIGKQGYVDRSRAQIVTRTDGRRGQPRGVCGETRRNVFARAISASPRATRPPFRPLRRRTPNGKGTAGNDAPTYRAHSHTRTRSPFQELKKAHAPRRRPGHLGANHKHKRVKHTTADSRARPPIFVPRFTHSSFLTVLHSLTRSLVFYLTRSLTPSYFLSHSRLYLSHVLPRLSPFSLTPSLATSATVASEARSTLRGGLCDTHRRDRSSSQPCAPNLMRAASFSHQSLNKVPEAFARTASSRKSNLKIFENNNKMAGKSLRDHCGRPRRRLARLYELDQSTLRYFV